MSTRQGAADRAVKQQRGKVEWGEPTTHGMKERSMFNFARRLFCLCYSYTCALRENVTIKHLNFKTYVSRVCVVLLLYECLSSNWSQK